jgi:hypothetical protein
LFNPTANTVTLPLEEVARNGVPLAAAFLIDPSGDISISTANTLASAAMLKEFLFSFLIFVLLLHDRFCG